MGASHLETERNTTIPHHHVVPVPGKTGKLLTHGLELITFCCMVRCSLMGYLHGVPMPEVLLGHLAMIVCGVDAFREEFCEKRIVE